MKTHLLIGFLLWTAVINAQNGNVGIGTTNPDTSAILDVSSIRKGILIPRVASAARAAIATPATGLLVFQTDGTAGFYYYNGIKWINLASGLTPDSSGYANSASYGLVSTFAGSGSSGSTDGTGTAASFSDPAGVAVDESGNVYVADFDNSKIRKITPAGVVTTLAGSGSPGAADGTGTAASFAYPAGVAVDGSGTVYVADQYNHKIRKITPAGVVTTLAGSGSLGSANGTGTAASFAYPAGVAVDGSGNVYVAGYYDNKIRKITPAGVVTTFAGSGSQGSANGTGTAASFNFPAGVAVDGSGNVYVADQYNNKIRKITPAGVVTTLAGSGSQGSADGTGTTASFYYPNGVAVDGSGNVYVADYGNNKIRKITPAGVVATLAGSGSQGSTDGTGAAASFRSPSGVALDGSGNVYVADYYNNKIRKVVTAANDYVSASTDQTVGGVKTFTSPVNTTAITTPVTGTANMLPAAYGNAFSNATSTINNSSDNCTLSHPAAGQYVITFTGSNLSGINIGTLAVSATLFGATPGFITFTGGNGTLTISTFNSSGTATDRGFGFAVYKP